jgi:hypothetical protein
MMGLIKIDQEKLRAFQREKAVKARERAYIKEADPLKNRADRGDTTHEEWLAKIEEIKARYPYPEEQP